MGRGGHGCRRDDGNRGRQLRRHCRWRAAQQEAVQRSTRGCGRRSARRWLGSHAGGGHRRTGRWAAAGARRLGGRGRAGRKGWASSRCLQLARWRTLLPAATYRSATDPAPSDGVQCAPDDQRVGERLSSATQRPSARDADRARVLSTGAEEAAKGRHQEPWEIKEGDQLAPQALRYPGLWRHDDTCMCTPRGQPP